MTRNQFLKLTGLKGLHRRDQERFINLVRRFKGKLSYNDFFILIGLAVATGHTRIDRILRYVKMSVIGHEIRKRGRSSLC